MEDIISQLNELQERVQNLMERL